MASAFAHAAAGAALWPLFSNARAPRFTWALGAALAIVPDIDVVGFRYGIEYGAPLGHRGLTHSVFVAIVLGCVLAWVMRRKGDSDDLMGDVRQSRDVHDVGDPPRSITGRHHLLLAAYLSLALASHGVLDAMTTGGLGVALLAPIDDGRYFFAWRPIAVSPIGIRPFFTERGLAVLANEALWVGLPSIAIALMGLGLRRRLPSPARHADRADSASR